MHGGMDKKGDLEEGELKLNNDIPQANRGVELMLRKKRREPEETKTNNFVERKDMLAVTLTFSVIFSLMFLVLGSVVGWIAKEYVIQRDAKFIPTHPEMFDENGQIIPDTVFAVRFENEDGFESSDGPLE